MILQMDVENNIYLQIQCGYYLYWNLHTGR